MTTGADKPDDGPPLVTIAVPTLNQGRFLDEALSSIFQQDVPTEVFLADGGSTDDTRTIIAKWHSRLAGWRSYPDHGQAAAVNECIRHGKAPFVYWLNSDDRLLPKALGHLLESLRRNPVSPAAYGKVYNDTGGRMRPVRVEPFDEKRLAVYCIISQPGVLIRRDAWEKVGGLREDLELAMDYDLWWRLYKAVGPMTYVDRFVGVNRDHLYTKTNLNRRLHYREAMTVVKKHHGRVPLKWWLAQPYAVWFRAISGWCRRFLSTAS